MLPPPAEPQLNTVRAVGPGSPEDAPHLDVDECVLCCVFQPEGEGGTEESLYVTGNLGVHVLGFPSLPGCELRLSRWVKVLMTPDSESRPCSSLRTWAPASCSVRTAPSQLPPRSPPWPCSSRDREADLFQGTILSTFALKDTIPSPAHGHLFLISLPQHIQLSISRNSFPSPS